MYCTQVTGATDLFSSAFLSVTSEDSPAVPPPRARVCDISPQMFTITKLLASRSQLCKEDTGKLHCHILLSCICTRYLAYSDSKAQAFHWEKGGTPPPRQSSRKFRSRVTENRQPAFHALGIGICLRRSLHLLTRTCHVRVSVLCWQHSVTSKQRFYDCHSKSLSKKTPSPLSS